MNIKTSKAGYNVLIVGNKCYRCGHEWLSRNSKEKPAVCPNCKSPYWDRPKRVKRAKTKDKN